MHAIRQAPLVVFWIAIIGLSAYFFVDNVVAYFYGYRSPLFGASLLNNQLWVLMHMTGGTLTLLLGPVQFWSFVRHRYLRFHRWAGFAYLLGIALIGVSAGRLSLISPCVPCRVSLFLLTLLTVFFSWAAWTGIKNRNVKLHRQMMVRSYVCVLAFVFVRVEALFPLNVFFGDVQDRLFRRVMNEYFFSFVPLLITEFVMVWWPAARRRQQPAIKNQQPNTA